VSRTKIYLLKRKVNPWDCFPGVLKTRIISPRWLFSRGLENKNPLCESPCEEPGSNSPVFSRGGELRSVLADGGDPRSVLSRGGELHTVRSVLADGGDPRSVFSPRVEN
jgi:hypothetical protein